MRDGTEADHIDLVLIPHDEVVGRQTGDEFESTGLLHFDFAVGLEDHGKGIVDFSRGFLGLGELFPAAAEGEHSTLVGRFELHFDEGTKDLHLVADLSPILLELLGHGILISIKCQPIRNCQ